MTLRARARTPLIPPEGAWTHLGAGYMRVRGRANRAAYENGEPVGAPERCVSTESQRKGERDAAA